MFPINKENAVEQQIGWHSSIGLGDDIWEGDFMYGQTAYNIRESFITFSNIRP